jgi:ElaB/YqjD/DUF883 family membrane-anchored ribosome-binding protein
MTQQGEMKQPEAQAFTSEGEAERGEARKEGGRHAYVNSAVEQTGRVLRTLSQKVRSVADSLREEQGAPMRVGRTVERVARKLESSADYLSGATTSEIRGDLSSIVRRNPVRTVGAVFAVGLLLGTVLRRRGV